MEVVEKDSSVSVEAGRPALAGRRLVFGYPGVRGKEGACTWHEGVPCCEGRWGEKIDGVVGDERGRGVPFDGLC